MIRISRKGCFFTLAFIIVLWYGIDHLGFLSKSELASGTVVGDSVTYTAYKGGSHPWFHHPVIEFTFKGRSFSFPATAFSSLKLYDECTVLFDKKSPPDAYEYSFAGYWEWGLMWVVFSFGTLLFIFFRLFKKNEVLVLTPKKIYIGKSFAKEE
ncbi:MAG TPA: hypothetical protein VL651_09805 [Bacteroidia bacterium]|jgi:hypothetical protein|nr:hypothetical protein [Bacteroidia bacterium]